MTFKWQKIYPVLENQDFGPGYVLSPKRGVLEKHVWLASGFSDNFLVFVWLTAHRGALAVLQTAVNQGIF